VANNAQNPQVEKIRQKLVKYQNFLKKNMEELEKNKNANNSSLMVKKEELDTIENSLLNQNQNQNNVSAKKHNNNMIDYSMKNNINNVKMGDKETLGGSNNNINLVNENQNQNDNNINNYFYTQNLGTQMNTNNNYNLNNQSPYLIYLPISPVQNTLPINSSDINSNISDYSFFGMESKKRNEKGRIGMEGEFNREEG